MDRLAKVSEWLRSIDISDLEDALETELKVRPITRSIMLNESPISAAQREHLIRLNKPYPTLRASSFVDRNLAQAMKSILLRIQ
uniref:Cell division protein n=1 Tax=Bursaphelenchus xylophilus TaxID=6326 RepID=A0A1I7SG58_BURXY